MRFLKMPEGRKIKGIETIKILNNTDISYFHIDVMDGNFVKQISIPVEETLELSKVSEKKLDIHLMHSRPLSYIEQIKDLKNIEYITIHLEIEENIQNILNKIKEYGFKRGISIKPNTDINKLIDRKSTRLNSSHSSVSRMPSSA